MDNKGGREWDMLALSDSIDIYSEQVSGEQLGLSMEEEMDCILKYQSTGDIEARDKVIKNNLTLVLEVCKGECKSWEDLLELVSIGHMALINSMDTFKAWKGCLFRTHVTSTIKRNILNYRNSLNDMARTQKNDAYNMMVLNRQLDETLLDEEPSIEWYDMVGFNCREYDSVEAAIVIGDALNTLKKRERDVIYLKYWKELPVNEIAATLNISPGYVYICENKALSKMRERITYAGGM